ncbi:MAG: hypothetical protein IT577_17915 [Verrucomicrobiae bacterium]|nr:hypothetical protein [Verrucomicrobiae bacterium]
MTLGKADVLREWLERRRALLVEETALLRHGRRDTEERVRRRIDRLREVAEGFSMMRAADGARTE